jgi:hypothetical protein
MTDNHENGKRKRGEDDDDVGVQQEERCRRIIMGEMIHHRWTCLAFEASRRGKFDEYVAHNPKPKWGEETDKDRYEALMYFYPMPFCLPIEVWMRIALFVEKKPGEVW